MEIEPLTFPGVDPKRPMIIAGPCSAESREQVLKTASELAARGVKIFRAGIWKPRTKPGGFEGIGVEGLPWMKQVKQETGMLVATEVATPAHVFEALKAGIDILWVGARTVTNPFAMQELADALKGVDIPILVKTPSIPTWNCGSARSNGSTTPDSDGWASSTGDSAPTRKKSTATLRSGIFRSNFAADTPTSPSSVTRATSAANANW